MRTYPAWLDRIPLRYAITYLRVSSHLKKSDGRLLDWGHRHLNLSGAELKRWTRRAWWGLVAGELLRRRLGDPKRRHEVLEFIDEPDWSKFQEVYDSQEACILAAAHVGPPKTAMNFVMELAEPTMIWTNKRDLPKWVEEASDTTFLDPTVPSETSTMLLKSALHLRDKGVLLGAPDFPTGQQLVSMQRLGINWEFSLGIPCLAKRLDLPVLLILALWKDYRLQLQIDIVEPPSAELNEEDWYKAWIESYWRLLEPHMRETPENIRKLRGLDCGRVDRALRKKSKIGC